MKGKWMSIVVLLVLPIVILGLATLKSVKAEDYGDIGDTLDLDLVQVPDEMRPAFISVVEKRPVSLLPGKQHAVVSLRIETDWALATLAVLDNSPEDVGMGDKGALVVLRKQLDGTWKAALEGTSAFDSMLSDTPDSILEPQVKRALSRPASPQYASMKFPWDSSQSWMLTQGWHSGNNVDFAPSSSLPNKWVLAAHDGTVTRFCDGEATANVEVLHSDGTKTTYVHLDKNTVPDSILGQPVPQGMYLGELFDGSYNPGPCGDWYCVFRDSCGYGTGPHIHFGLPAKDIAIDGWVASSDNIWRRDGQTKGVRSWFNSSNTKIDPGAGDVTPPSITFTTLPSSGQWYNTNRTITWSITDNSGGSGVRGYKRAWDQNPPQGTEREGASGSIGLGSAGQGKHNLYVRAWDNAGNASSVSAAGWFGYDNLAPTNPTFVSPNCNATNNIWQNTCNDASFSWSGASDGNGSGVKDYHYYWGESENGTPATYTSNTNYDPPALTGSVAVRYLRLATRDNLDHESNPSTVFVLLYDASLPTVTFFINQHAETTNQTAVSLSLSANDTGSGVADFRISNNGLTWSDWQPYADGAFWNLSALNRRTHTVYVQVRDRASNESAVASDSIYLDLYPPMPHSDNYRICADVIDVGGSAGITSTGYALVSAIGQPWATGAISNTGRTFSQRAGFLASLTGCLPITYFPSSEMTVTQWVVASGGNLRGSTSYRLGDTAGQPAASGTSAFTSTNYTLSSGFWATLSGTVPERPPDPPSYPSPGSSPTPTPGPTPTPQPGGFGVSINDGALYTNDPAVTVHTWAPNVTHQRLSDDGGYADQGWMTYRITTTWALSTYGEYVMPRYVYAWFRDASSNVYGAYFDDIIYDPVAPQGRVSLLGSGGVATITLWLEAYDDNSGVAEMRVSEDLALSDAVWQPFTNTLDWVLDGDVVYAQFSDNAGNLSPVYSSADPGVSERIYLPLIIRNQ